MKKITKLILAAVTGGCLLGYITFCGIVYAFPEMFLYHPSAEKSILKKAHEDELPFQEVDYQASDQTKLTAWFIPAEDNHKTIVFMHGNAGKVDTFYPKMRIFAEKGYGILMPEYRGFGGIKGKITQENLEKDALAAIDYLTNLGYKNEDIYLYGMSLGSHMAVHTAVQRQEQGSFAGVILEVPFDSLLNTAKKRFSFLPFDMIIRDEYDNMQEIQQIKSPILIMGAEKDKIVPVELAQKLYDAAPDPKDIIIYEKAHHGNLQNFHNDLDILKWIKEYEKNI